MQFWHYLGRSQNILFNVHRYNRHVCACVWLRHEHLLKGVDNLDLIGCFCLTELGFGNNAVKMETTATYDEKTQEFIINCPTPLS